MTLLHYLSGYILFKAGYFCSSQKNAFRYIYSADGCAQKCKAHSWFLFSWRSPGFKCLCSEKNDCNAIRYSGWNIYLVEEWFKSIYSSRSRAFWRDEDAANSRKENSESEDETFFWKPCVSNFSFHFDYTIIGNSFHIFMIYLKIWQCLHCPGQFFILAILIDVKNYLLLNCPKGI